MGLAWKTTMGRPFTLLSIEGADLKLVVGVGERGDSNEKRVVGHQHQHGICLETPLGPFQSAQLGVSLRNWESRCEIGPHFWELKQVDLAHPIFWCYKRDESAQLQSSETINARGVGTTQIPQKTRRGEAAKLEFLSPG